MSTKQDKSSVNYKELINSEDNKQTNYGTFKDKEADDKKCKHCINYELYIARKDHLY